MTWARLDDSFPEHPKVAALTDSAFRLWTTALCYSARNLTDGLISPVALRYCGSNANLSRPGRTASTLVTAGLWEAEGDAYRIHDYLDYNPSKADVERDREAARERMRRRRSGEVRVNGSGERSRERSRTPTRPVPEDFLRDGTGSRTAAPPADSAKGGADGADTPPTTRKTRGRDPEPVVGKKPWNRDAAEALIRNIGWLDPHPADLLTDTYDQIPADDLIELTDLASDLANAGATT
jgi:hypothetical protein